MHETLCLATNSLLVGLLVAALIVTTTAVAAEPVAGTFQASGTTTLRGPHDLAWDIVGASIRPAHGGAGTAGLQIQQARLQWINIPYTVLSTNAGVADRTHGSFGDEEVFVDRMASGTVSVRLDGEGDEVQLLPQTPGLRIESDGAKATILPAGSALAPPPNSTLLGRATVQGTDIFIPQPHTHAHLHDLAVEDVRSIALVPVGTVWLPGEDGPREAGRRLNESRSHIDPLTGSGSYVYDTWVLLASGGGLDVRTDGLDWHLAATHVEGAIDGTARWQGVAGAIAVNGTRTSDDPTTLEVEGDVRVSSDLRDSPVRWSIEGDAVRVGLDNEPFWRSGTAAAGLGVLTVAGLLAGLRGLATLVLGRATPTLLKANLDSPSRRRILQAIHAHQPVRPADLPRLTGLSRGSLRYHLRILGAYNVLQEHTPAGEGRRAATLMLNSGSHTFYSAGVAALVEDVPGSESSDVRADEALGVAHNHPLRRALYQALLDDGPADFQTLRDRMRDVDVETDLQQSRATYHLQKLRRAGVIASRWVDGRKVYEANLDSTTVRAEQYHRYLRQQGALDLVRTLADRELDRAGVIEHLQRGVGSRRSADRVLRDLVAVAILEPARANRYRLTPPLQTIVPTMRDQP